MIGVACIGQVDHGKTSLLSAISHLLPGIDPLTFRQSWSTRLPEAPAAPDARPLLEEDSTHIQSKKEPGHSGRAMITHPLLNPVWKVEIEAEAVVSE